MKIKFSRSQLFSYLTSVLISVFLVAAFVFGATTISTNVDTGGTLNVSGGTTLVNATTSTSLYVSGVFQANGASSTLLNVRVGSGNATVTSMYVSGAFNANGASSTLLNVQIGSGSATTTNLAVRGTLTADVASSSITNVVIVNATSTGLYVSGPFSANGASSTLLNVQIGSGSATVTNMYVSGAFQANGASSTVVNLRSTSATSTYFDVLSGSTAVYQLTPGASTTALIARLGGTATTTLLNAYMNAFSFATSTDGVPVFSIDTTAGGRIGVGTTVPATTFAITSRNATTTLYLDSTANRTCLQLESATGTPYRLYIDESNVGAAPNIGGLRVELGSCN